MLAKPTTRVRPGVWPSLPLSIWVGLIVMSILAGFFLVRFANGGTPPPDYPVVIASDVSPKLAPSSAAAVALKAITANEQQLGRRLAEPTVLSVEAFKGSAVPQEFAEGNLGDHAVVWIVKARGTFVSFTSRPGIEPLSYDNGFFAIDDSGTIIGMGLPLP